MKITLPTAKVKEFISLSKSVESESSDFENLQVLKYIKIEIEFGTCKMTKTSQRSFIEFTFEVTEDDCELLILEKELKDFCAFTSKENISFIREIDEKTNELKKDMIITDGYYSPEHYNGNFTCKDFPKIPNYGTPSLRIPKEVLLYLNIAKTYTGTDELRPMFKYAYINKNTVTACNMRILFIKSFDFKLPEIALSKEECSILSAFDYADFSEVNEDSSWNIYKFGNAVYGFRQNDESEIYPYEQFFEKTTKRNYFEINTKELINFCNSTKIVSKSEKPSYINSKILIAKSPMGYTAELIYNDREKRKKNKILSEVNLVGEPFEFYFDHNETLEIFKSLPYDKICLSNEVCFKENGEKELDMIGIFSKDDKTYMGLISKLLGND